MKDRRREGQTLNNLGLVYADWGEYDKAVKYYEQALSLARQCRDRRGEANALNNLANVYKDWGKYNEAVSYYENSLTIKRDLKDRRGEGQTLNNLGLVYWGWGEYDKAVKYYEQALAISRDTKNRRGEGIALNCLAVTYKNWGEYGKALALYHESLNISRELSDPRNESYSLNNMAQMYRSWGRYNTAEAYFDKSLDRCRAVKNRNLEGTVLANLGNMHTDRGEYTKALIQFRKSLEINTLIGVPTIWPRRCMVGLFLDSGQEEKAVKALSQLASDYADARDKSGLWALSGRVNLAQGHHTKAGEFYERLLQSAETTRDTDDLFNAYTGLGTVSEALGQDTEAADYFRKAVEHTENLRSSLARAEREKFLDVKIGGFRRTAPYEGLARVLMRMNKPIEALEGSEYTKARVFAEAMSRRVGGENFDVPAEVLKKDEQINDQLAALKKSRQKAFEKKNQLTIKSLEPQIRDLEKRLKGHIKMLWEKYPLFAATKYPRPMPLAESALKGNEWVLAYDVTDSGVLIYLTRGKELIKGLFKPIPRKELDALVRKFREPMEVVPGKESLTEKLKSFDFASGRKLAEILLQDVLAKLPKDTPLIVVPDDSLGVLPFEILVLNDAGKVTAEGEIPAISGAEFFGDRNPISYYQSITALTLARTYGKGKSQGKKLLVMADPVFQLRDARAQKSKPKSKLAGVEADMYKNLMVAVEEGELGTVRFNRLPMTGDLARELSETYKGDSVVFTGLDASKKRFMANVAPNLAKYSGIVFATHGYFGKNLPGIMEPVLVLSLVPPGTDGYLRLSEVMGLKMNADMVALTACQTGLGRRISGEGVMGMGRVFQYAGAESVLMSLWSVAEASSVKLVESFFRHLKEGKSKLEALRLARKEIRETGYDHPFFWAPFILVGEVD